MLSVGGHVYKKTYIGLWRWPPNVFHWCAMCWERSLIHIPGSGGLRLPQMYIVSTVASSQTSYSQQQHKLIDQYIAIRSLLPLKWRDRNLYMISILASNVWQQVRRSEDLHNYLIILCGYHILSLHHYHPYASVKITDTNIWELAVPAKTSASATSISRHMAPVGAQNLAIPGAIPPKWEETCPRSGQTATQNFTPISEAAAKKSVTIQTFWKERFFFSKLSIPPYTTYGVDKNYRIVLHFIF